MHHPENVEFSPRERTIYDGMVAVVIAKHESRRTAATYGNILVEFFRWIKTHSGVWEKSREERVSAYLSNIAPHCAAKTQNQKLCAIVRYFREVERKPLGDLPEWCYAKVPRRLPTWLTHDEINRLLPLISGTAGLMCRLTYGAGLRLMEITRLRVQDLDMAQRLVFVRAGKGNKDRIVPLPVSLIEPLRSHLVKAHALWMSDMARGAPAVYLPDGLERKYPNAGKEWRWYWVFPGRDFSRDPATGIIRRHHISRNAMQKAISLATHRAAITKRVGVHTLRHSFATHHLLRGTNIKQLQGLLGHNSLETTQVYLHCLPNEINRAGSPLDDLPGANVITAFDPNSDRCIRIAL